MLTPTDTCEFAPYVFAAVHVVLGSKLAALQLSSSNRHLGDQVAK